MCSKKSFAKRLYIRGTSIIEYIDAFNKIILNLEDINVKIDDEDKLIIFLSSLPESCGHFVDILLYRKQMAVVKDVKKAIDEFLINCY